MKKNFAIIFLLGLSAGLPLALVLSTLKALLVDKGFDLATIGFFAIVTLPYSLKFCFAPFIDSCSVPILTKRLGQRRSWLIVSQMMLILFTIFLGITAIFSNLNLIFVFAFLVAFASASQDIVIDAYRIELIAKEDQGIAATLYVYGYRIGMLISGAFALVIAEIFGWDLVCFVLTLFMLIGVGTTIFAKDTRENWQSKNHNLFSWFRNSVIEPFLDFTKKPRWLSIVAFVICFKLCDAFAGNLTLPFLMNIGFTKIEIAAIVKTFGLFATLLGALFGAILVKKLGVNKSLWIAAILQMLSNLSFSYLAKTGNDLDLLYVVIFIENFSGGIGDSVFVAYLSGLCNLAFSATQYALLSSLASVARSTISSSAGIVAQYFGWYSFFIISAFLALPGLIFLLILTISFKSKSQQI